jgi:hypothetical protein
MLIINDFGNVKRLYIAEVFEDQQTHGCCKARKIRKGDEGGEGGWRR